jgi:hypothetical protein
MAHCRAQFPGLRLLLTRDCEGTLEIRLCFRGIRLRRPDCDFPGNAMHLGLAPAFLARSDQGCGFANAAPSVIELAKLRIGARQIR